MATWDDFAADEPRLASTAQRVLCLNNAAAPYLAGLAYLATIRADGGPRIHPISPVQTNGRLYAFVLSHSPKARDLARNGHYALHSFPHPLEDFGSEEIFLTGRATIVTDPRLHAVVARTCGDDPASGQVYELDIARLMYRHAGWNPPTYATWRAKERTL
jgi:hypothetical protein